MEVDAACVFEDAVHFIEALRHIGRIGKHLTVRDHHLKASDDFARGIGDSVLYISDALFRVSIIEPHIIKGFDLRLDRESTPFENSMILLL